MGKKEAIEVSAVVTDVLPNSQYRVHLDNGRDVLAYAAGKLKLRHIRIIAGDRVLVELSPYDLTRGRISWRGEKRSAGTEPGKPPSR